MRSPVISSVIRRVSSSVNSVTYLCGLIYNNEIFFMQYVLEMEFSICACRIHTKMLEGLWVIYILGRINVTSISRHCSHWRNDIVVLLQKMSLARIFVHVPALSIGTLPISTISSFWAICPNIIIYIHATRVVRTNVENTSQRLDFGTGHQLKNLALWLQLIPLLAPVR